MWLLSGGRRCYLSFLWKESCREQRSFERLWTSVSFCSWNLIMSDGKRGNLTSDQQQRGWAVPLPQSETDELQIRFSFLCVQLTQQPGNWGGRSQTCDLCGAGSLRLQTWMSHTGLVLLSLWKQLYDVVCGSGGEINPDDVIVMSSGLSQIGLGEHKCLTRGLRCKLKVQSLKDVAVNQVERL